MDQQKRNMPFGALLEGLDRLEGISLFPHQADGVAFLLSKKRAILGDDMGLGKTRQAIAAMEAGASEGPILIVRPAALKLNWRREIHMIFPDARVEVIGFDQGGRRECALDHRQLRPPAQARGPAAGDCLVGRRPRRGPLHQEQQPSDLGLPEAAGRPE
jgi:hypothetical protein